jgi:hypothetical protein
MHSVLIYKCIIIRTFQYWGIQITHPLFQTEWIGNYFPKNFRQENVFYKISAICSLLFSKLWSIYVHFIFCIFWGIPISGTKLLYVANLSAKFHILLLTYGQDYVGVCHKNIIFIICLKYRCSPYVNQAKHAILQIINY